MKSQIKVLHLIDSGGLYGAENVVLNLSRGLNKLNWRSIVGCFGYRGRAWPEVGRTAESMGLETVVFQLRNKVDLTCAIRIGAFCRRNKVAVIHSHGYKPSLVCLLIKTLYGIPYVVTCHLWYVGNARLRLYTIIEKICMLFASSVVGVSEEIVSDLLKAGVPQKKLRVIDNGIETPNDPSHRTCDETDLRRELGLGDESFVIGSLGRLTKQKDHATLLRAAAEILRNRQDVEFMVAGDGELRGDLVTLSRDLGIEDKFHFLGFRDDKEDLLRLMDIFVLSSLDEGLPIAMLEAMAMRLPIIATKVGGIPEVIRNRDNGILVETGSPHQLSEAMIALLNNRGMRETLGENAYNTVRDRYSNDGMTEHYVEVYEKALRE